MGKENTHTHTRAQIDEVEAASLVGPSQSDNNYRHIKVLCVIDEWLFFLQKGEAAISLSSGVVVRVVKCPIYTRKYTSHRAPTKTPFPHHICTIWFGWKKAKIKASLLITFIPSSLLFHYIIYTHVLDTPSQTGSSLTQAVAAVATAVAHSQHISNNTFPPPPPEHHQQQQDRNLSQP